MMQGLGFLEQIQQSAYFQCLAEESCIHFSPAIPQRKLQAADYIPESLPYQDVLMLIDDTVFGSGKAGLAISERGIYFRESFENGQMFLWQYIQTIEADIGLLSAGLDINGQHAIRLSQLSKANVNVLAMGLNELLMLYKKQQQTVQSLSKQPQVQQKQLVESLTTILQTFHFLSSLKTGQVDVATTHWIMAELLELSPEQQRQISKQWQQLTVVQWHELRSALTELGHDLTRDEALTLIEQVLQLLVYQYWTASDMQAYVADIAVALQLSMVDLDPMLEHYLNLTKTSMDSTNMMELKPELHHQACQLFGLNPASWTESELQHAYHQQMAELNPMLYPDLPEQILGLIRQHAQQLHQARKTLLQCMSTANIPQ